MRTGTPASNSSYHLSHSYAIPSPLRIILPKYTLSAKPPSCPQDTICCHTDKRSRPFLVSFPHLCPTRQTPTPYNRIFTARFIQFAMFISTLNNKFPCILCILITKLITKIQVGTFIRQSSYNSRNNFLRIKKYQMRDCRRLSFAFVDNRSIRGILFHSPLSQTFLLIFGIRYGNYLAKIYAFLFRIIAFRILR